MLFLKDKKFRQFRLDNNNDNSVPPLGNCPFKAQLEQVFFRTNYIRGGKKDARDSTKKISRVIYERSES